jgi:hypothetical protein
MRRSVRPKQKQQRNLVKGEVHKNWVRTKAQVRILPQSSDSRSSDQFIGWSAAFTLCYGP